MLFAASTASLGVALYQHDLMSLDIGFLSAGALLPPALFGMWLGQKLRSKLSQDLFQLPIFGRHRRNFEAIACSLK